MDSARTPTERSSTKRIVTWLLGLIVALLIVSTVLTLFGLAVIPVVLTDTDHLCVLPATGADPNRFEHGAPVRVWVLLKRCGPSRKTQLFERCSIERSGESDGSAGTLVVSASAGYLIGPGLQNMACVPVSVSCWSEPLEAGTYLLRYRDKRLRLTVPSALSGEHCTTPGLLNRIGSLS